jgi:hypothetical protein
MVASNLLIFEDVVAAVAVAASGAGIKYYLDAGYWNIVNLY